MAELAASEQISTHARHGYRFLDVESAAPPPAPGPEGVLQQAREAYERGEWQQAITLLQTVDDLEGLGADDLQRWAHSAQCLGRPADALHVLERAVAAYSARGD